MGRQKPVTPPRGRRVGPWGNWLAVGLVLSVAAGPMMPLLLPEHPPTNGRPLWTGPFLEALFGTLWLGGGVAVLSGIIGFPLGLLAALYSFPGRRPLVFFQALPLLLPSFLLAIGWSNLASMPGMRWLPTPDGNGACLLVLGLQGVPLVFFATWAAAHALTTSQIDVARLHGGERQVLWLAARASLPVALLGSLLAGVMSLSDTGASLIFGARSVAVEILTNFSALFDYDLARRQCLVLGGGSLLITLPLVIGGYRKFASAILARQISPVKPFRVPSLGVCGLVGLATVIGVGVLLPTIGLCLPAFDQPQFGRAWKKVASTAATTFLFTGGAASVSVVLAGGLALVVGRRSRLRSVALIVLITLLAMPPAMAAMGVARLSAASPPGLDWLLRSGLTVPIVLGLRFLPVAAIVMMRAVESQPRSWHEAARLHGVAPWRTWVHITLPHLKMSLVASLLLVAMLAAADITITHQLQPPGWQSLPVAIFTIMANSPQGLVASLCLLYLGSVVMMLAMIAWLPAIVGDTRKISSWEGPR